MLEIPNLSVHRLHVDQTTSTTVTKPPPSISISDRAADSLVMEWLHCFLFLPPIFAPSAFNLIFPEGVFGREGAGVDFSARGEVCSYDCLD